VRTKAGFSDRRAAYSKPDEIANAAIFALPENQESLLLVQVAIPTRRQPDLITT
jgi:hypothetical protein